MSTHERSLDAARFSSNHHTRTLLHGEKRTPKHTSIRMFELPWLLCIGQRPHEVFREREILFVFVRVLAGNERLLSKQVER